MKRIGKLKLEIVHGLYRVLFLLAAMAAFGIWWTRDEVDAGTRFSIGLTLVLVFSGVALLFRARYNQLGRQFDAEVASEVVSILEGREPSESFVLYLRPFGLEGRVVARNPSHSAVIMTPGYFEPEFIDAEAVLARLMRRTGPLVALGNPDQEEQVAAKERGAGLYYVREGAWKDKLKLLAESARLILVIPWDSESCLWEIGKIKDGSLHKSIFIVPEELTVIDGKWRGSRQPFLEPDRWKSIRQTLAEDSLGLQIPSAIDRGVAFTLDSRGDLDSIASPFSLDNAYSARKTLRKLLPAPFA